MNSLLTCVRIFLYDTTNTRHQKWKDDVKGRFIFIVFTDTVIDALIVKKQQYDYFMVA